MILQSSGIARSSCTLGAALLCLAAGSSTALGDDHIKAVISKQAPKVYWPLEHSFAPSLAPSAHAGAFVFDAYETNGPTLDFSSWDNSDELSVDYLPLRPDHTTCADGTTALVFAEENGLGDPRGIDRRLEHVWPSISPLIDPLGFVDDWTIHLIVYPDADDDELRGTETVFHYESGDAYIKITVEQEADDCTFTIECQGGPSDPIRTATVTLDTSTKTDEGHQIIARFKHDHSRLAGKTTRLRLEVDGVEHDSVGGDYNDPSNSTWTIELGREIGTSDYFHGAAHHLAIWPNELDDSTVGDIQTALRVDEDRTLMAYDWTTDNPSQDKATFYSWLFPTNDTTDGVVTHPTDPMATRFIADWDDPIWDHDLLYPMARLWIDNNTRTIDWTVTGTIDRIEKLEKGLRAATSNGKSILDGPGYTIFWQNWGVSNSGYNTTVTDAVAHPLVRNWRDVPEPWRQNNLDVNGVGDLSTLTTFHRPVLPVSSDETYSPFAREGISKNAFVTRELWEKVADGLKTITITGHPHSGDFPPPSRAHWDFESGTDELRLTNGWDFDEDDDSNTNDATDPAEYAYMVIDPGPPVIYADLPKVNKGWWAGCFLDERSSDPRFWPAHDLTLMDTPDLPTGVTVPIAGEWGVPFLHNSFEHVENRPTSIRFQRIAKAVTEWAIDEALITTGEDVLGTTIRWSNYNVNSAADTFLPVNATTGAYDGNTFTGAEEDLRRTTIGSKSFLPGASGLNRRADFSAPYMYPIRDTSYRYVSHFFEYWDRMHPGEQFESGTVGKSKVAVPYELPVSTWFTSTGIDGNTDSMGNPIQPVENAPDPFVQDTLDAMYVESCKHTINAIYLAHLDEAATTPQRHSTIWLPYPGLKWDANGDLAYGSNGTGVFTEWHGTTHNGTSTGTDFDLPYYTDWEEIARIAVFAYRRGVREYMYWGGSMPEVENAQKVLDAVEHVTDDWADYTTGYDLVRFVDDEFGIPDGTKNLADYLYFLSRFFEGDIEADVVDVAGTTGRPDGKLTSHDFNAFRTQFNDIADINCDGVVNCTDYDMVEANFVTSYTNEFDAVAHYNTPSASRTFYFMYDLNNDGAVDSADLAIIGTCP